MKKIIHLASKISIVIILLLYAIYSVPVRHGDGHEYSLTARAVSSRLELNINQIDIENRLYEIERYRSIGFSNELFSEIKKNINHGEDVVAGIYKSNTDKYYGVHFPLYPALVGMIEKIVGVMGGNPLAAFQVFNVLLLFFAVIYSKVIYKEDGFLLVFIMLICGGQYYIKWTHPEIFVVTMLTMGLLGFYKKNPVSGVIFLSLASLQVVTLWLLSLVVLVLYLYKLKVEGQNFNEIIKRNYGVISAGLIPVINFLFYYINYGKLSLIGSGFTDLNLITLNHMISMFLDLDQGVIVGMPIVIGLIFMVAKKELPELFLAIAMASIIALPLLAQTSVNSGQSVFQRYSFYMTPPLILWSYLMVKNKFSNKRAWFVILIILSIIYSLGFKSIEAEEDYLKLKPWVKYIYENFPEIYNPEPGVFYARVKHEEWRKGVSDYAAFRHNGYIKKILIRKDIDINGICDGQLLIISDGVINAGYGYIYRNGNYICNGYMQEELVEELEGVNNSAAIYFSGDNSNGMKFKISGFDKVELDGRWTNSASSNINLRPYDDFKIIKINYTTIKENYGKIVNVIVNGNIKEYKISDSNMLIINEHIEKNKELNITLLFENLSSPKKLKISSDSRLLGMNIKKIELIK